MRICFSSWDPVVLDVETGKWRKLSLRTRNMVNLGSRSVCVNGSIYWFHLHVGQGFKILALDLHKEEFHNVSTPANNWITWETQIVNLEDRLALAKTKQAGTEWILEILSMDAEQERWSKIYSINLTHKVVSPERWKRWFIPVAVSKQGNLVFCDNQQRLFKYYPRTDDIRCLSSSHICVISPYLECLVPFPLKASSRSDFTCCLHLRLCSRIYKVLQPIFICILVSCVLVFLFDITCYILCYLVAIFTK